MSPRRKSYFREKVSGDDLREAWFLLSSEDRLAGFRDIPRLEEEEFFLSLDPHSQAELILGLPEPERRAWIRLLAPDDAADLIQQVPVSEREGLLDLIDDATRKEIIVLLAYAEDEAGGLMNPQYVRLRPDISVDEAISYLRRQTRERVKALYYAYVLDSDQHLLGVVSYRELLSAQPDKKVEEIMKTDLVTVTEKTDQEAVSRLFAQHGLMAIPVVDDEGGVKGIVTVDDIVHVVREEATEDIQKIGGSEALDAPYLQIGLFKMLRKRAGWLTVLFLSEMLTSNTLAHFEGQIAQAVVLALFIPLIISSGGNSGSQASTLVIRAIALGEVKLRDWWRIFLRELVAGLSLGGILGAIGLMRILLWPSRARIYGEHYFLVALTIAGSLVGVVLWGTVVGSMLPFALRRVGLDPASASAPFVATLVDVSGLVIYFNVASFILRGTLL